MIDPIAVASYLGGVAASDPPPVNSGDFVCAAIGPGLVF